MKVEKKEVMYESPEAARKVTMHLDGKQIAEGYLSICNFFFKEESSARYQSHTHKLCECGEKMSRGRTKCTFCSETTSVAEYLKKPFKEWNGTDALYCSASDKYFFSEDEIEDFLGYEELDVKDLRLVICEENHYQEINEGYWEDVIPEDGDLPKTMSDKLDELNELIKTLPPASYSPGKYRTEYRPLTNTELTARQG